MLLRLLSLLSGSLGLLRILAVVALFLGYTGWVYSRATDACHTEQARAALKGVETHAKIEGKNETATDKDLDRRMKKWYRD